MSENSCDCGEMYAWQCTLSTCQRPHGGEIPDRSTWPADLAKTNPALYRNITPTAPELSITERIVLAYFDAAEPAPESWVQQHRSEADCWCNPIQVGTLGVWTHQ